MAQFHYEYDTPTLHHRELTKAQIMTSIFPSAPRRRAATVMGVVPTSLEDAPDRRLHRVTPGSEVMLMSNDSQRSLVMGRLSNIRELFFATREA